MLQVVETHIRKRGFFGWTFLILFWAFNAFMALWAWLVFSAVGNQYAAANGPSRDFQQAGTAIGGAIDGIIILLIWALGAVILGLMALLTRGRRTVTLRNASPS